MHSLWQDVRYGLRGFRKQPAFTALAVLTLAIGIGATTTIFSVIQNVLLDPFPYEDVGRVVNVHIVSDRGRRIMFEVPEFLDYEEQVQSFQEVIGGARDEVLYTTGEGAESFAAGLMTPNNFRFLGVSTALGRPLQEDDAKPGAPPVFVMRHRLWVSRFGQDPSLVGKTFVLDGVATTLVGITIPRFSKLGADVYLPARLERGNAALRGRRFMLQARLKRGVTLAQAQAEVLRVAKGVEHAYPELYPRNYSAKVVTLLDTTIGPFRTTLYIMAAAVGLLLLIACSNVANLLLARATARQRELALRSALGAERLRLVRQLLVESGLLALGAAALGCVLAYVGLPTLVASIPEGLIPGEAVIRLDARVLLFSLALAVATAFVFGLVPALRAASPDLVEPLKDGAQSAGLGFRRGRLGGALVVAQVALSLVLLTAAGLLMRTFVALRTVDLGLDVGHVLHVRTPLPRGRYATLEARRQFFSQVVTRMKALPGVVEATLTSAVPPFGAIRTRMALRGRAPTENAEAFFQLCSEGYFRTIGLRLQRGRLLSADDVDHARKVVVVNRRLADQYFGGEDALGRVIELTMLAGLSGDGRVADPAFEIVGVVADARNQGLRKPIEPEAFVPYTVTLAFNRGFLLRTTGNPIATLPAVRQAVWAVDPDVPLTTTGSVSQSLQDSLAEERLGLLVFGVFAAAGLLLVVLGLFSLMAYTVSRQTREIGIRMALGARRADVLRLVFGTGLKLVGAGFALGIPAALVGTRALASQLFGVTPQDPATLGAVCGVLLLAGGLACFVPARRATRVQPLVALRHD